jgi:heme exporter protein D
MSEQHWLFVVIAYAVAFVSIGGVAFKILLDHQRLRDELARFDGGGRGEDDA